MNRLFVLALTGSSLIGLQAASAADIFVPPPPVEYIEVVKPDYSGWYIRGDAGYVFESKTSGRYDVYRHGAHGDFSEYHYDEIKQKNTYTVGGGVGYRWAEHFRTDASLDYYDFAGEGKSRCPSHIARSSHCVFNDRADADVWTIMANAYVDLPYFGPFTPYAGAGLGLAHVSYGDMTNEICQHGNCAEGPDFVGIHAGEDSWRFASSLMAGVSYDVTKNLALDVGYRYTRVFEGDAYGYDEVDTAAGASGVQGRDHGFNIHAVRAGLRYSFF